VADTDNPDQPPRDPGRLSRRDETAYQAAADEETRVIAEEGRTTAESLREEAERGRRRAESRREYAERDRDFAEAARSAAEGARAAAEAAREETIALRSAFDEQLLIMREMQQTLRALEARVRR